VAVALASAINVPVRQFNARRSVGVTGYGAASKAQVQAMVARLCGLAEIPKPADARTPWRWRSRTSCRAQREKYALGAARDRVAPRPGLAPSQDGAIVLDVHDVGYEVSVASQEDYRVGDVVDLYVFTAVRDDAIVLYGFPQLPGPRVLRTLAGHAGRRSLDRPRGPSHDVNR